MNFNSVEELILQIRKDIDDTKKALAEPECLKHEKDPYFD